MDYSSVQDILFINFRQKKTPEGVSFLSFNSN